MGLTVVRILLSVVGGRDSGRLGAFDGEVAEQVFDFCLAESAVTTGGADGSEAAGAGPPGDGFGVDPEHLRDLSGGKQTLGGFHRWDTPVRGAEPNSSEPGPGRRGVDSADIPRG